MYAIVAESADRLVWQQVPDVSPGPGQVLVKVSAAGVNRADLLQAAGLYPPPPGASELLGMEVSGIVAEVGGDPRNSPSAYAELPEHFARRQTAQGFDLRSSQLPIAKRRGRGDELVGGD